jgi:hypothetical protein
VVYPTISADIWRQYTGDLHSVETFRHMLYAHEPSEEDSWVLLAHRAAGVLPREVDTVDRCVMARPSY